MHKLTLPAIPPFSIKMISSANDGRRCKLTIMLKFVELDQKRKLGLVKRIQKQIDKFALTNEDIQFAKL